MNRKSLIAVFIAICSIANYTFQLHRWENPGGLIGSDVIEYYAYLPSIFIYKDLTLKYTEKNPEFFQNKIKAKKLENGNYIIKMSSGLSILYLPFFLLAHISTHITGCPPDGYTSVYEFFLAFGTLVYVFIALLLLRKILLTHFSDLSSAVTIISISLGTNLFSYASYEATMTHAYSFCLFLIFLTYTTRWNTNPSLKNSIILGLTIGLISLIRPTNAVIILIFIFWDIHSFSTLKKRFLYFFQNRISIILMMLFAVMVWLPQMCYWKHITDHWLYYSYSEEGFFFSDPKITEVLFSYRKGWLLYTPIMAFSVLGLFFLRKTLKTFALSIPLFFILNIYIVSSWWCWWYGGSFGQRALIESYAILALPFAAFTEYLHKNTKWLKYIFFAIIIFFIYLNIYQTRQYRINQIHFDSMTQEAYWSCFLRKPGAGYVLKAPDIEKAKKGDR